MEMCDWGRDIYLANGSSYKKVFESVTDPWIYYEYCRFRSYEPPAEQLRSLTEHWASLCEGRHPEHMLEKNIGTFNGMRRLVSLLKRLGVKTDAELMQDIRDHIHDLLKSGDT